MKQKIDLVRAYIKEVKGLDVNIYIRPEQQERDIMLLNFAYMKAIDYFNSVQKK